MTYLTKNRALQRKASDDLDARALKSKRIIELTLFVARHRLNVNVRLDRHTPDDSAHKYNICESGLKLFQGIWLTPERVFKSFETTGHEVPNFIAGTSTSSSPGVRSGTRIDNRTESKRLSPREAYDFLDWDLFLALKADVEKELRPKK